MLNVDGAEAVASGVPTGFAVDTIMLVSVIMFQGTVFGGVSATTSAADVCDFSAVGGDMLSIDGVALVALTGFREEFACGAAFAEDIEVVVDRFVRVLGCAESDDHEGGTLSFETSFYWFYPAGESDGFGCEVVGRFDVEGGFGGNVEAGGDIFDYA